MKTVYMHGWRMPVEYWGIVQASCSPLGLLQRQTTISVTFRGLLKGLSPYLLTRDSWFVQENTCITTANCLEVVQMSHILSLSTQYLLDHLLSGALMKTSGLTPLVHLIFAFKSGQLHQQFYQSWCTYCCFLRKKTYCWGHFWHSHATVPSTPFCTTATINKGCARCLAPLLAETAGACCQVM